MRTVVFSVGITLCFVCNALEGTPPEQSPGGYENLDQYIGHELVTDHRAEKAGIHRTLPLSCPPFLLRDVDGKVIDPTKDTEDKRTTRPVSTKQTCGACHDYDRITRGYHFQAGKDELFDDPPAGEALPPHRGPGFWGKWQLLYQRELAPKEFDHPDNIDLTPYEWVNACGICHPGGGPAEYDRANRRCDETLEDDRGLALFMDSDYYESGWVESGVVEADCFICHLETYDYSLRAQQLKKLNYKWAATAAAGLGFVWGSVKDRQEPNVYYRKELFGPDGTVHLKIRRPSDRQCMSCHDMSGVQKRGTTWHSNYIQDVHTECGMQCIDCHPGDIRHNFAKRHAAGLTVRLDLDRTMVSCRECHERQEMGAANYTHPGIPELHFNRLACTACHITRRPFLGTRTVDTLTGKAVELPVDPEPDAFDGYAFGAMWGKAQPGQADIFLEPFTPKEIERALDYHLSLENPRREYFLNDDGTSRLPNGPFFVAKFIEEHGVVENADARALMLIALERTGRTDDFTPVCVVRGQAYAFYAGELKRLDTQLQPRRSGATIAGHAIAYVVNPKNGKITPAGYQLGAFWAYRDGDVLRPLFLKDMQAAWEYLHSDEFRFYTYPAQPADCEEALALPDPANTSEDDLRSAIQAKLDQYDRADRERLDVYDDNNDTHPEANTDDEIGLVAWALGRTLDRLDNPELYYIKGTQAYKVTVTDYPDPFDAPLKKMRPLTEHHPFMAIERYEYRRRVRDWKYYWRWEYAETRLSPMYDAKIEAVDLAADPAAADLAQRLCWTTAHGVEPGSQSLGANGCTDCHAEDAHFFYGKVVADPFGPNATPATVPMYQVLGYTPAGVRIGAWREQVLRPIAPWVLLAALAIMLLHFVLFGVHERTGGYAGPEATRFGVHERIAHAIVMASVVVLALTGFFFLLGKTDPLGSWARPLHTWIGFVAGGGVVLIFLCWFFRMFPAKGDLEWLLGAGGYLGGQGHYPAGKFNVGQKILFWLAVGLMAVLGISGYLIWALDGAQDLAAPQNPQLPLLYTVHDVAALAMLLVLLAHVYLATALNPHSLRSLFGGKVSAQWAQEHHPDWNLPSS